MLKANLNATEAADDGISFMNEEAVDPADVTSSRPHLNHPQVDTFWCLRKWRKFIR